MWYPYAESGTVILNSDQMQVMKWSWIMTNHYSDQIREKKPINKEEYVWEMVDGMMVDEMVVDGMMVDERW